MTNIFDVDVSGNDLLEKNYTICVANKEGVIRGFKLNQNLVATISSNYNQGLYRYQISKRGKSLIKMRIYCIIIYFLIKSLNLKGEVSLNICRDFPGLEKDIIETLKFFLGKKLKLNMGGKIHFMRLSEDSNAHHYSYLMRHDYKNQMKNYVNIDLKDIEKWLLKK